MRRERWIVHALVVILLLVAVAWAGSSRVRAACHPIGVTWYSPTGVAGCERYGVGTASMWQGPGAARNDCVWPWRRCQTIRIQSLTTGLTIVVTPTMFCDCWQGGIGPNGERPRIVDLDPSMIAALGLDPSDGLWKVRVTPVLATTTLPNTAMEAPE